MAEECKYQGGHGLAFTEAVLRLQRDVHAPEPETTLAPLIASVAALRKATSPDACAECALAVWRQLAAMDLSTRGLEFPPPSATDAVKGIIRRHIWSVHVNRPGSGGNKILHGVVGVGKSTMLQVLCVLQALYHPDGVVVLWDYEKHNTAEGGLPPGPNQLVRHVTKWADGDRTEPLTPVAFQKADFWTLNGKTPSGTTTQRLFGLFFDEINNFYSAAKDDRPHTGAQLEWGKWCVHKLVALGKDRRGLTVCTASASRLRSMAFATDDWGAYPSMNISVYEGVTVLPLREAALVQAYTQCRYNVDLTMDEAKALLDATGGVGRDINHWFGDGMDTAAEHARTVAATRDALTNNKNPEVQAAFVAFASLWYSHGGFHSDAARVPYLDYADIPQRDLGTAAEALLENHSLLVTIGMRRELLKGAMAGAIVDYFQHSATALQRLAFRTVVSGWHGARSAGAICEKPVLLDVINDHTSWKTLRVVGGVPKLVDVPLAECDVGAMGGVVVRVGKDMGADAFVLRCGHDNTASMRVEAYQLQLGEDSKYFTPGNVELQRGKSYNRNRDTTTLAGVIANLEVAWRSFKEQLEAAFPGTSFTLTKARLVSNKPRSSSAASNFTEAHTRVEADGGRVHLDELIGERLWSQLSRELRDGVRPR